MVLLLLAACGAPSAPAPDVQTVAPPAAPSLARASWAASAYARLGDAALAIAPVEGGWAARVASVGTAARFEAGAAWITGESDTFAVRTVAWGRGEDLRPTRVDGGRLGACVEGLVAPDGVCVARLERRDRWLTEWWANERGGLRQGWVAQHPPDGSGALRVSVAVEGAEVAVDPAGAELRLPGGEAWSVGGLAAWDATGRALPIRLDATAEGFDVVVDDAGATYPVEIDPVYTTASATLSGPGAGSWFGWVVEGAGDVNGDGYDDVVVGAYLADAAGADSGAAYVYHGSAGGLSTTAATTLQPDAAYRHYGYAVAAAGDVDGDGYDDVLVSEPDYTATWSYQGRVFLYRGGPSGVSTAAAWSAVGGEIYDFFGTELRGGGDLNGDGFADVVVGARDANGGAVDSGRAFVYYGSATGLGSSPTTLNGSATGQFFGDALAMPGDVNGDGYDDLVVGYWGDDTTATDAGRVALFAGGPGGVATTPAWTEGGDAASDLFGYALGGGDVNGDGYGDILVGAPLVDGGMTDRGAVYVYLGGPGYPSTTPSVVLYGAASNDYFGDRVSTAGDVDGDGDEEVIVGAHGNDAVAAQSGAAYLYTGGASGPSSTASVSLYGTAVEEHYGTAVATAGDVDGDGFDDVLVGAWSNDGAGSDAGRVWLYRGYCDDHDGDGVCGWADCDDGDAAVYPGAPETCDGVDQDCDGVADDDAVDAGAWFADVDGDGFGDATTALAACDAPEGYGADASDCDDGDAAVYPGAPETCDDVDQDCDGVVDEDAVDPTTWYADGDGDGFGDATSALDACDAPPGFGTDASDCDDGDAASYPGAPETCDDADQDCDGAVDEDAIGAPVWYADFDGDGYGDPGVPLAACDAPPGYVGDATDCDDTDDRVNPGAFEIRGDGVDNDCRGGDAPAPDADGDGWVSTYDCDDGDAAVFPGAAETCNNLDDDCDGAVDENVKRLLFQDADGDGRGVALTTVSACPGVPGYATLAGDCDDGDPERAPGLADICDGKDNDCDGDVDERGTATTCTETGGGSADRDGDGWGSPTDCADGDPTRHPGAAELCNGLDDDCDGSVDEGVRSILFADADGDGWGSRFTRISACAGTAGYAQVAGDCADTDAARAPGLPDTCDGVDNDCDLVADERPTDTCAP